MYNEGALKSNDQDRQPTFMEVTVKRTISTSESISMANQKLNTMLCKLRGNKPTDLGGNNPMKKEGELGYCDKLDVQLSAQVEMLNLLHVQLDELLSLI